MTTCTPLRKKSFENVTGKGENVCNQHFLLFLQYFYSKNKFNVFSLTFHLSSVDAFNLDKAKTVSSCKGFID